jgi:hypothetical protein
MTYAANLNFDNYLFTACPKTISISISTGSQLITGETTLTCLVTGVSTNLTYTWLNGSSAVAVQTGSIYNIEKSGNYNLICIATYTNGRDQCALNKTLTGTAIGKSIRCSTSAAAACML